MSSDIKSNSSSPEQNIELGSDIELGSEISSLNSLSKISPGSELKSDTSPGSELKSDTSPGTDSEPVASEPVASEPVASEPVASEPASTKSSLKFVKELKKSLYEPTLSRDEFKQIYAIINKQDDKDANYKRNLNILLNNKELFNNEDLKDDKKYNYLYPNLDDPNFNIKIAERKEFHENQDKQKIVNDLESQADEICNADFELAPHQLFVKNFLSFYTPYNGLLLFHGLGTGKTCSAIGIAEETRDYLIQLNINQKIKIIASPNVQKNFRQQLFDERKLEFRDGNWNIQNCIGNKFLKEININSFKELSRKNIISQINTIINTYYEFSGYTEFANEIIKSSSIDDARVSSKEHKRLIKDKLNKNFNNRLIIIDEIQNIRTEDDSKNKMVAQEITRLVDNVENLKLVLLSATPIYNNYREIIWLINLLNRNDNRSQLEISDVFDSNGDFVVNDAGIDVGRELLERKARGYISFVKGDNPYTFPYRIWPADFNIAKSVLNMDYPKNQLNNKPILHNLQHIDIYIDKIAQYQELGYNYIIDYIKHKKEDLFADSNNSNENKKKLQFQELDKFGYTMLQKPIEALNIIYPNSKLEKVVEKKEFTINPEELIGKSGLNRLVKYEQTTTPMSRHNFEFKTDEFGNIFSYENIEKYSSKIKSILDSILNSTGIVLIYSQYIDGGLIPVALALESIGLTRHGDAHNLFKTAPSEQIDYSTYLKKSDPKVKSGEFNPATYVMITGDKSISPNNLKDLNACTNDDNVNGARVKVVLISQAAAEGLDFKFIRQVHILDPWYNMNRVEQIIGRGVRHCSHKKLPFRERNVQIFLHGTELTNKNEAADLYVYRLAELKSIQIGKITRLLKSVSVDCILNSNQQNFRENILNKTIEINLSNNKTINYKIGDKPFTAVCDYMDNCYYKCAPDVDLKDIEVNKMTYSLPHIELNSEKIIQKIKELMKMRYFYYKLELIPLINLQHEYSAEQIDYALTELVNNKNQFVVDKYERIGNLINIDDLYIFQPIELSDKKESVYNRMTPIEFKHQKLVYNVEEKFKNIEDDKGIAKVVKDTLADKKQDKPGVEKILEENTRLALEIIKNVKKDYNIIISDQLLVRGEENYYKSMSVVIKNLMDEQRINRESLYGFALDHILESLTFENTIVLLNYLYNKSSSELSDIEQKIFNYYSSKVITNKGVRGLILQQKNEVVIVVLMRDNLWKLAESEDYKDLEPKIKDLIIPIEMFNKYVGFIGSFKGEFNIFRVKQMDKKRNKGARCDQSGKSEALKILNDVLGELRYNAENTKRFNQHLICIYQELYLRLFDSEARGDKRWFFYPGEALVNNIEKVSI